MTQTRQHVRLPYPPLLNHLYRRAARGGMYMTAEAVAWKDEAGWRAREAGIEKLTGPVAVELQVYRPRRVGDVDATTKVMLDAMNGIAWDDDSQVVELHVYRHDAPKPKRGPRVGYVEMTIWRAS